MKPNPSALHRILADAVTRIAQKACRNGENSTRTWPPLSELPLKESWMMIGELYAPQIIEEIANVSLGVTVPRPTDPDALALEEAITIAEENSHGDSSCARENRRLAEWLRELRVSRRALKNGPDHS